MWCDWCQMHGCWVGDPKQGDRLTPPADASIAAALDALEADIAHVLAAAPAPQAPLPDPGVIPHPTAGRPT